VKKSAGAVKMKKSLMFREEGSKDGRESSRAEKRIPNERKHDCFWRERRLSWGSQEQSMMVNPKVRQETPSPPPPSQINRRRDVGIFQKEARAA
jgi:hypothetical protein